MPAVNASHRFPLAQAQRLLNEQQPQRVLLDSYLPDNGSKGIEEKTLTLVRNLFTNCAKHCYSVDDVVSATGRPPAAILNTAWRQDFWMLRCCTVIPGGCTAGRHRRHREARPLSV